VIRGNSGLRDYFATAFFATAFFAGALVTLFVAAFFTTGAAVVPAAFAAARGRALP
jgi:hypothetical protein